MFRLARTLLLLAVVAVVVAGVAWWLIEPELRARASRAATNQLGDKVTIGALRPSATGLVANDVSFDHSARGIEIRTESMAISPSLSSLVNGRGLVVDAVSLRGVDVFLAGREYGSAEALRRFLPGGKRLLSLTGLSVVELRKAGFELAGGAVVTFSQVRFWHVDGGPEKGRRTLVHEESRLRFRRVRDAFVLDE